ncbi:NTP transferase domain-containing protein [Tuwongella immobilis]|uniref:Nucleotidyl transferase domain-containing protein n=1 Tax=Tuwongella immobilis TaxID=692036 RepID=A0A6C2YRP6_9BACT|nr:NTP transferase domain-containing protein [Tuwongella immobilis]VIP03793.1 Uncharacterized protein OS=Pirellula staleyi (strain ATCC 27377 / DSM 6068 / ICPB 4128) GN=Psta_4570 PE=4 SV=1: NTP_transf_3 [Tuwongella immobilis]VTS04953.1 Uncharacterized protein OS=Pirellula staleyi (strain ATCC 27377 / DSM 6068 / ICPB 4128) GN=Psta_4570 PE=4 SV=1: NTP_transf_3 [Tuwongella immobilis]
MQLVIPMAGLGQRFQDAGYTTPKPLIPIDGVPMILRVIRELPVVNRVVLVVHPQHVAQNQIDTLLRAQIPHAEIVVAPGLTQGQACSVALAEPFLKRDESVLVSACDNSHLYDESRFTAMTTDAIWDALIWTYSGEPRVVIKPEWYGWVRADEMGAVQEVSCKRAISDRPISDPVVSGTFWFRSAELMLDGIERLIAADRRVNREFYLDVVPNLLLEQGKRVAIFPVEKYIGWGTPDDVADYERWTRYWAWSQSKAGRHV